MPEPKIVGCPRCGTPVAWTAGNRYRPFCSERCKLIDLGAWAMERYRVPAPEREGDSDNEKPGAQEEPS
jgi:endogenous inhibitor of DNA gyrase (YacG/DUF329 family)